MALVVALLLSSFVAWIPIATLSGVLIVVGLIVTVAPVMSPALRVELAADVAIEAVPPGMIAARQP